MSNTTESTFNNQILGSLFYSVYKWLVIIPVLVIVTTFVCINIIPLSFLGFPDFASRVFGTFWARVNLFTMLGGITVEGAEKIDKSQSYIVAANHQSLIDIYVIYGYLGLDIKWVMKKELQKIPLMGKACEVMGHIIVDRSNSQAAIANINNARTSLLRGNSVIFFPEGTRSSDGNLLPFKKGAFRLATELNLPILPIVIQGTRDILPSHTMIWRPGTIEMKILDPISAEEVSASSVNELSAKTRSIIEEGLNC